MTTDLLAWDIDIHDEHIARGRCPILFEDELAPGGDDWPGLPGYFCQYPAGHEGPHTSSAGFVERGPQDHIPQREL